MTSTAIILFNVEMNAQEEVKEAIKKIKGVTQVDIVFGVYDIVARVETENMEELTDTVSWHIRRLPKVQATLTMVVAS